MKVPVSDSALRRFDAWTTRRPVAFIGFVLAIFGFVMLFSPQHQLVMAWALLSLGGVIDTAVVAGILLLRHRQSKQEVPGEAAAASH